MTSEDVNHGAQDALNRMARAEKRGTGCYLTAEMIDGLRITPFGQCWHEPDPRKEPIHD